MDDLKKLTRIILIGLGIYILIEVGRPFLFSLPYFLFYDSSVRPFVFASLLSSIFAIAYAILIIYVLFYKANFLTEKIVGAETPSEAKAWWLPFSFRLTAVFCGIYFMYHLIPSVVAAVSEYVMPLPEGVYYQRNLRWDKVANWVVSSALAIYLLFGAPHFIRWQVRKTLEQCKELAELEKAADEKVTSK